MQQTRKEEESWRLAVALYASEAGAEAAGVTSGFLAYAIDFEIRRLGPGLGDASWQDLVRPSVPDSQRRRQACCQQLLASSKR